MRDEKLDLWRRGLPALALLRQRYRRVHFVGIAGAGMAALAEVCAAARLVVSGSDPKGGRSAAHLRELGIVVHGGHDAHHVPDDALLVHTAAVDRRHPEVAIAARRGQTILGRGELLAFLMQGACGIAVMGAHGKSTTAGMCALILEEAGMSPWAAIGARIPGRKGNATIGRSSLLVAEVDESDGTIERVAPLCAAVTSIDREHLDRFGSFEALRAAFARTLSRVPPAGVVVPMADDPIVLAACKSARARVLPAGITHAAEVRGTGLELSGGRYRFRIAARGKTVTRARLAVPGLMNVRNALVAAGVALALGAGGRDVKNGLGAFTGMGRRFEQRGTFRGVTVIDDYAHHPREIHATLSAARDLFGRRRLVALFEPHRPSRLAALLPEFARELATADRVVVAPLYGAFEKGRTGVASPELAAAVARSGAWAAAAASTDEAVRVCASEARRGDVVIVMGAGHAETMADDLSRILSGGRRP
ncbi:MAG: UDP-N-acetylmuramate--L-alanine ligase [Acidobacteriota bacterium]